MVLADGRRIPAAFLQKGDVLADGGVVQLVLRRVHKSRFVTFNSVTFALPGFFADQRNNRVDLAGLGEAFRGTLLVVSPVTSTGEYTAGGLRCFSAAQPVWARAKENGVVDF